MIEKYKINDKYCNIFLHNLCPHCEIKQKPTLLFCKKHNPFEEFIVVTTQCSNCFKPYAYIHNYDSSIGCYTVTDKQITKPKISLISSPVSIEDISITGNEIYIQSLSAEKSGYNHLVGIGLRKALEFCLKDFLCIIHPEQSDMIKNMFLKNLIDKYINDPTLQKLAKGCSYLGNDETHYVRKNESYDLQALKKFIELTFQMIRQKLTALEIEKTLLQ